MDLAPPCRHPAWIPAEGLSTSVLSGDFVALEPRSTVSCKAGGSTLAHVQARSRMTGDLHEHERTRPTGRRVSKMGDPSGATTAPPQSDLVLAGQQRALAAALREKDQQVETMYLGALHVLRQSANPDRMALAAHGMRELMEKLPEHLDVPSQNKPPKGQPSLNVKVRELAYHWTSIADEIADAVEINSRIRKFNKKAKIFFEWFEQNFHTRREQTAAALRAMDTTGRSLPIPIEELRIRHWKACNEFFQGVAHHGKICTEEEFVNWLSELELFLLDHLQPRTFDDFTNLDEIIAEGERDA